MRRIPVLLALVSLAAPAGAAVAEVERHGARLRLTTAAAAAEVALARYRLRVLAHGRLLTAEHPAGGVFYERAGGAHRLGRVRATAPREDGVVLTVDTDEGAPATVTLAWLTPRTLEVTMEPPLRVVAPAASVVKLARAVVPPTTPLNVVVPAVFTVKPNPPLTAPAKMILPLPVEVSVSFAPSVTPSL